MKNTFWCREPRVGIVVAMALSLGLPSVAFPSSILGSSQSFAVLGGSDVTNTGPTTISGNVGVYPGSSITGFGGAPNGTVSNGTIHITDPVAQQAQTDERFAYNTLALLPFNTNESGTDLGGLTLTPGVYRFTSAAQLTGTLTLDFLNRPNALFVFQIGSTLTTASAATVNVINGTATDGIFWQIGSSATLGSTTTFAGNILALTSVSLDNGAKIECGRAFAQTGGVTLINNVISSDCSVADFGSGRSDFGSAGFSSSSNIALVTPEPGSFLLFGISLLGLAVKFSARKK